MSEIELLEEKLLKLEEDRKIINDEIAHVRQQIQLIKMAAFDDNYKKGN